MNNLTEINFALTLLWRMPKMRSMLKLPDIAERTSKARATRERNRQQHPRPAPAVKPALAATRRKRARQGSTKHVTAATAPAPAHAGEPRKISPKMTEQLMTVPRQADMTRAEQNAMQAIFSQIPRSEIAEVLARAPIEFNKPMQKLLMLLGSAEHGASEWPTLCRHAGVAPAELMHTIVDTYLADTNLRISRHLPGVMEEMVKRGRDRVVDCPICYDEESGKSLGYIITIDAKGNKKPSRCLNCINGRISVAADKDAVKMALEVVGAIGQRGPATAMQFNFGSSKRGTMQDPNAPDMSEWTRETDSVFEERSQHVQEAETL